MTAIGSALFLCSPAFNQISVDVFAGPQYDRVALASYQMSSYQYGFASSQAYVSSGAGGHLGCSMIFGNGSVKGSLGFILAWQHLQGDYVRSEGGGGHGGWGRQTYNGRLIEDRAIMELPLGLVLGGPRTHISIGLVYWLLLGVNVHDSGTVDHSSWNMINGSYESTTTYDERTKDRKPYVQYGPAANCAFSFLVEKRFTITLSYTRSFWDMYVNESPSGQLSTVRLGFGYRLVSSDIK